MKRVIKFRALTFDQKWVYGFLKIDFLGYYQIQDYKYPEIEHNVLQKTIGQYIGRNDKHGKEIYEGDLIKKIDSNICAEVIWEEGFTAETPENDPKNDYYDVLWFKNEIIEIVGNVHEAKISLSNERKK